MTAESVPEFELREARPDDAEFALPCFEWLFAPPGSVAPGWDNTGAMSRLKKLLQGDDCTLWLALTGDGRIVGICSVYLDIESVRYGLRAWVEDLAVAPDHRSAGIGAALLKASRGWAKERGATHLELDSGINRKDAHRFYESIEPSHVSMHYAWQL